MRWAEKARQDKLEWSILDVEQDEWERRLAALGVAAAANGFPVYPAAPQAMDERSRAAPLAESVDRRVPRSVRRILAAVSLLAVLGGMAGSLAGYGIWRRAQQGIARMQGDVANAVKVESLQENSLGRMPARHESVQTVEFLGNAAQATVVVTRALAPGGLSVQPELRFYVQTPGGWQRSEPIAGFWGPTETLDTAHLHFVFGRRDRTVVGHLAPAAEALYATLRRATGQNLDRTSQVPIEIIPGFTSTYMHAGDGRIRMTSPALYTVVEQERGGLLGRQLRLTLSQQLMAATAKRMAVKPQWQPLVQALGAWLAFSDSIPFAPDDELAASWRLQNKLRSSWRLADLQRGVLRYDPASGSMQAFTLISDAQQLEQQLVAAEQLIDFIVVQYGIDVLPKLLRGFAQYDEWEELAPVVLGVTAAELERAWHAGG